MSNTYIDQRLITLSSDNATQNNGSFLSDVTFNFVGLLKDDKDVEQVQISVQNAQFPISFYNVNVYNNVMEIEYNLIPYTLTLTRGNYNSTTLITEIKNQLINADPLASDVAITISSITGILTFSSPSLFSIIGTGTINKVLGFVPNTNYNQVGTDIVAPYPLNLLGLLKIKIASYELQTGNYDSATNGNLNILATIPIEAGSFGLVLYDNISNTQSIINNPTLDGFDLKIYGDDNNLINFNGIGWNITLLLAITRVKREKSKTNFSEIVKPIMQLTTAIDNQLALQTQLQNPQQQELSQQIQQPTEDLGNMDATTTEDATNNPIQEVEDLGDNSLDLLLYNQHQYL